MEFLLLGQLGCGNWESGTQGRPGATRDLGTSDEVQVQMEFKMVGDGRGLATTILLLFPGFQARFDAGNGGLGWKRLAFGGERTPCQGSTFCRLRTFSDAIGTQGAS